MGYLIGHGGETEIQLPSLSFAAVDQLFVKLERRFGFFDGAGWREVPLDGQ